MRTAVSYFGVLALSLGFLLLACGVNEEEHQKVVDERDTLAGEKKSLQDEVARLQAELDAVPDAAPADNSEEIARLQAEIDAREAEIARRDARLAEIQGQLNSTNQELAETQREKDIAESDKNEALRRMEAAEEERAAIEAEYQQARNEAEQSRQDLMQYQTSVGGYVSAMRADGANASVRNAEMREQYQQQYGSQVDSLQSENQTLRAILAQQGILASSNTQGQSEAGVQGAVSFEGSMGTSRDTLPAGSSTVQSRGN